MKQVCVLGNGQLGRMLRQAGERGDLHFIGNIEGSRWALRSGPSGWTLNRLLSLFSKA